MTPTGRDGVEPDGIEPARFEPARIEPARIEPDTKDWTWTLERPCPECGFDARSVAADSIARSTTELTAPWREVLRRDDVALRPAADVWSPLEYACHVRDVCRVFAGRVRLMTEEVEPTFPDWDQDQAAVQDRYGAQDPSVVDRELADAAAAVAAGFAAVAGDQWSRRGWRSNGSAFTVESLGRYFLHDLAHHLVDVGAAAAPGAV
jgi:hypothetical protein